MLRGGLGVYAVPFIISGVVQHGFSQATELNESDNLGLTFRANLANPYPAGVLTPAGASLGVNTFLGQNIGRFAPSNLRNGENARYLINIQRELPGQWLFEAGYTGSRGWDITTDLDLNPLPAQYLSTSPVRDQANIDLLAQLVANPFAGLVPGVALNNATVARSQLLRPFPQFTAVTTNASDGSTSYNSFQTKLEHRFSKGYHAARRLHAVEVPRARVEVERDRHGVRRPAGGGRHAAPAVDHEHLRAPVRQRAPFREQRRPARRQLHRRMELPGDRPVPDRFPDRFREPATTTAIRRT